MQNPRRRVTAAALVLALAGQTASAGSLGASSAAGGSSASAGSSASSESSGASSDSSGGRRTAAAGPYRITAVVALADRPDAVRVQLQAVENGAPLPALALVLPAALVQRHRLAVGEVVTARPQAYGTAFVAGTADGGEAFHLLLDDGWQRELDARPVNGRSARS